MLERYARHRLTTAQSRTIDEVRVCLTMILRPATAFRRQAVSAQMHPVTLAALGVLLVNDLLFKSLWPGAWAPGKLSDLAWMVFAPPVLAYTLSFALRGNGWRPRAAFVAAYVSLPLLYVAFNTFDPVHDVVLDLLGIFGGDGPRSPLDPTDSLVIPFAMVIALWVWSRPPLGAESIRARLALLATIAAALASVATSYWTDPGIYQVGKTASGALGTYNPSIGDGSYESRDGGLTWTRVSGEYVPIQREERSERVETASGDVFMIDDANARIVWERSERELSPVYSYGYLQTAGNRWMQALDKREIANLVIATEPTDLFYDEDSGNLIVSVGLQGVVVIAPDGKSTRVAVGPYSPTDFSFVSKLRTFFSSLLSLETVWFTCIALLLAFSFAALAVAGPAASYIPRLLLILAAAISSFFAISFGTYPYTFEYPWDSSSRYLGGVAFVFSGFGFLPLLMAIIGLAFARPTRRKLAAVAAASIGMLLLIVLGALVLFETGPTIANFVAVGLVGLAALGVWMYQRRTNKRDIL